ncbi:MAG: enoyl-CoA hydratase/isomerase family protein [Paucimonas sp.]|nr:enoyl-CoA hydratase/isomerase family protein [Paucimonas sp.]
MNAETADPQARVLVQREGDICHVTLNRPDKLNSLDEEMVDALLAIVTSASTDGTRVMSLRGNGRNFCAGFDLGDFEDVSHGDLVLRFVRIEQLLQALYHAPFQTLAFAHGKNFGAGVDIICSCNRRMAAPGSSFRMPGLRFGLVLGSRRFAQRVGMDRARDILMRSHQFDSEEALAIGFIHQVAPVEQWDALARTARADIDALSAAASAALLRVTAPDTRAQDLADLVQSAAEPGLKDRLRAYRAKA